MFGTKLHNSKKGFAYLLIVSIFVAVLVIIFLTYNSYSYAQSQHIHAERILTMNDFVKDFNEDIHRATFISAFRALVGLEDYITVSGSFLNNTQDSFREIFYNGTINGTAVLIMDGSSFSDYVDKVNTLASNVGITSSIEISSIDLSQVDPWIISVTMHAIVNVSDYRSTASWSYEQDYTTNLPIYNLRDPLYGYFTNNKVPNTIRPSPYSLFVNGTNVDNLDDHIGSSYYIASNKSPSFLQRFENNVSAHPFGIESIVNIGSISDQDLPVFTSRVKVDTIYFNDLASDAICDIEYVDTSLYFVVPSDRINLYNLSGLNYSTSC